MLLCDHGYIRERAPDQLQGKGRPASPSYDVNPCVSSHKSQKSHKSPDEINSAITAICATHDDGGMEEERI